MMHAATLLLVGATLFPALLQDDPSSSPAKPKYPMASQIVAITFQPEHLNANELYLAARGMIGGKVWVTDDETGVVSQRTNLQPVGNTLVVFDLPKAAARAQQLLASLDAAAGASTSDKAARTKLTVEYRPRNVGVETITASLAPFMEWVEVQLVRQGNFVVLSGPGAVVAEMQAFLERVDVPAPQITLTCYLVVPGEGGPALPKELTAGLSELTRIPAFKQAAMGMVRSSVQAGTRISVMLDAGNSEQFTLDLIPEALDERNFTLTLSSVGLTSRVSDTFGNGAVLFQTSTSVESERYTVLGAAGSTPYFVVLRTVAATTSGR
jgi:hypothetical protein